jgi:hypothetical protein
MGLSAGLGSAAYPRLIPIAKTAKTAQRHARFITASFTLLAGKSENCRERLSSGSFVPRLRIVSEIGIAVCIQNRKNLPRFFLVV